MICELPTSPLGARVWRLRLDREATPEDRAMLSEPERAQADRFYSARHGRRYTVCHAEVRRVLGSLLGRAPASLRFRAGAQGKPALDFETGLRFNLSHSGEYGLLAAAWGRRVGIDLEGIRAREWAGNIARRYFSPTEVAQLEAMVEPARLGAFYRLWSCKEAFIKATGLGLTAGLHSFDIRLGRGDSDLVATRPDPADARRWTLRELPLAVPGFAAAVVVESPEAKGSRPTRPR